MPKSYRNALVVHHITWGNNLVCEAEKSKEVGRSAFGGADANHHRRLRGWTACFFTADSGFDASSQMREKCEHAQGCARGLHLFSGVASRGCCGLPAGTSRAPHFRHWRACGVLCGLDGNCIYGDAPQQLGFPAYAG